MLDNSRQRNRIIVVIALLVIAIVLLLLLTRCPLQNPANPVLVNGKTRPVPDASAATNVPATTQPDELLTPATLTMPERVTAGAAFVVAWTGPDNRGDFLAIVPIEAPVNDFSNYRETEQAASVEMTAPIEPGPHEVRYVTGRSHTIVGRAPIEVVPAGATIEAPDEVVLGTQFDVAWTGPNNKGDYVTIVAKDALDAHYGSYTDADKPSPQTLTAPTLAGDAELRYVTGQGKKVLVRRPIRVLMPDITLSAAADAIAGATIAVEWTGPNNAGDYITVVASDIPDGQYGNYTVTSNGSPLNLLMPIMAGEAELRYMTGQGNRVLGRRAIKVIAAQVTLSAAGESKAGADVDITWTGPNYPGDYITIVPTTTPDGQYGAYTMTAEGSPLIVAAPKQAGDAEIRYMTGQGSKVLARVPIKVVP